MRTRKELGGLRIIVLFHDIPFYSSFLALSFWLCSLILAKKKRDVEEGIINCTLFCGVAIFLIFVVLIILSIKK